MICRNCQKKKFNKISKIGYQPISSIFLERKIKIKKFSLDLFECKTCKLIQLSKIPGLKDMYGPKYGYKTSISNLMIKHLGEKYNRIRKLKVYKKNKNILDIGSNDGTFLNFFKKEKNVKLTGIDPSALAFPNSYDKKIEVINDFFNDESIKNYFFNKKFSVVSSFAMFYDVEDPNSFSKNIYKILDKNGIWILEFSYFPLLLHNLTYDQICHEHVMYYTLNTFNKIIKKSKLKIIDFSLNEINGGSIEIICSRNDSNLRSKKKKISKILREEKKISKKEYKLFNLRIKESKKNLKLFLKNIKRKDIIGYGASTKGNVILNYCGINNKDLPFICDANPSKTGKFTPGSHIPIISKAKMRKINPKFLLVLIWSFRTEVINQEKKFIEQGGKLLFPLPKFHMVDKENYKKYLKQNFKDF